MNPRSIAIPWGLDGEILEWRTPEAWPVPEVVEPDLSAPIVDYPSALESALAEIDVLRSDGELGTGKRVAIVVDDPTRWTPVRAALPPILERLQRAGVMDADITICVGVGRHHAVDDAAMRERVGPEVVSRYRCESPPVDHLAAYRDLGTTPEGIPVRVFRPVADADLRILIGSVLPHLQAGFGGGYKLIFPGTSHRTTLSALHRVGIGAGEAGRRLGESAGENPMRRAIASAASLLGPCVSVSHLLGAKGEVLEIAAGVPESVQDRLAASAARRFRAPDAPAADLIVAGNHPWPGDPMMSFKVLLNHRASVRPGGVMIGLFWATESEIDRSFSLPALRAISATGAFGGWSIERGLLLTDRLMSIFHPASEFMIRWARELVVDRTILVYSPLLRERVGKRLGPIRIHDDPMRLWQDAAESLGTTIAPRIRVYPRAGLTYAPEPRSIPAR
ncbi:MAG: lactate racemase domain-containing protein [Isosphaeraceae bacterium]|nr:lactate racemase domain-containing protein [Isosphaeraceae bacterium]